METGLRDTDSMFVVPWQLVPDEAAELVVSLDLSDSQDVLGSPAGGSPGEDRVVVEQEAAATR